MPYEYSGTYQPSLMVQGSLEKLYYIKSLLLSYVRVIIQTRFRIQPLEYMYRWPVKCQYG